MNKKTPSLLVGWPRSQVAGMKIVSGAGLEEANADVNKAMVVAIVYLVFSEGFSKNTYWILCFCGFQISKLLCLVV